MIKLEIFLNTKITMYVDTHYSEFSHIMVTCDALIN